jgi:hypothetical protein
MLTTGLIPSLVLPKSRSDRDVAWSTDRFTRCTLRFELNLNMRGSLLSFYEFLQLQHIDPFMVEKYLGIIGNEVA